jgi:hypothetical protein
MRRSFILLATLAALLLAASAAQAATGVTGGFELTFTRNPNNNPEPSLEMTLTGTFASAGADFFAEATYPLPGGSSETAQFVYQGAKKKAYFIYPETLNHQELVLDEGMHALLAFIPQAAQTVFTAGLDGVSKLKAQLKRLGPETVAGEKLTAYSVVLPDGAEAQVPSREGRPWTMKMYFGADKKLRAVRVSTDVSSLLLKLKGVARGEVPASQFALPEGYYPLEPINVRSAADQHNARRD